MVETTAQAARYERYKDSGVEWLGEIPAHWELLPLFALTKLKSITNQVDLELLSVYLDLGVIRFSDVVAKRTNVTSLDLSKYQLVEPGDFVLNNQQAWRGSVGVSKHKGIISPAYIVLSLNEKFNPDFANYLFRDGSMVSQYLINSKGVGTIQRNLYWPSLRRSSISLPPLPEQTKIAQYLDHKTTQIDEAITIKEKQISLLKERKQILIHKAVTQGLNPNVRLKDSGVEWIGEIPGHWEVLDIRRITMEHKQGYYSTEAYVENGIKLLRITDFRKDGNLETTECPMVKDVKEAHNYILIPGDFVFARTGGAGNFAIFPNSNEKIAFASYLIRFRFDLRRLSTDYLKYYFNSSAFISGVERNIHGGVNQNIHAEDIKAQKITLPPLEEQLKIVNHTNSASQKIETAVGLKQQEIDKLKEYKSSLINGVVTGKTKVC